jgi:hypothetical protein
VLKTPLSVLNKDKDERKKSENERVTGFTAAGQIPTGICHTNRLT